MLLDRVFVITETRALTQDIRPVADCNFEPDADKNNDRNAAGRLLENTPLQGGLELLQTGTHKPKNTPEEHMLTFYKTFDEVKHRKFDGLVITGAPVEHLDFEEVEYWMS